jgi:hypothetical protein
MKTIAIAILLATLFTGCASRKSAAQVDEPIRVTPADVQVAPAPPAPPPAEPAPEPPPKPQTEELNEKRLSEAVDMLRRGERSGAIKTLQSIAKGKRVEGVTDEALFRLAMLTLKPTSQRGVSSQAEALLKRLRKEFPKSQWTAQAAPLMELIKVTEELRHQNLTQKATNQSLTAENDQLNKKVEQMNQTLQQLKHLDVEMEKKTK